MTRTAYGYNRSMDGDAVTAALGRKTGIKGGIRGHRSAARKGRLISPPGDFLDLRRAGGAAVARNGAAGRNRTFDPALTKGVLYP